MQKYKIINITGFPQAGKTTLINQYLEKGSICFDYMHLRFRLPEWNIKALTENEVDAEDITKILNDPRNFDIFYNVISKLKAEQIAVKTSIGEFDVIGKYDLFNKIIVRDFRIMWILLSCEECYNSSIDDFIEEVKMYVTIIKNSKNRYEINKFEHFHKSTFTEYDNGLLLKLKPYSEVKSDVGLIEQKLGDDLKFFGYEPTIDIQTILKGGK